MPELAMDTEAIVISGPKDALALNRPPDTILDEATTAAKALKHVIDNKEHKVVLNGKTYLQFEDWQTLGRFYGVTALAKETKYVEFGEGDDKVKGFEAKAEALLVGTNQVISAAEAMCLDDEQNWGVRYTKNGPQKVPLFQLKSMAQTRACAKVLRNVLAWVVVLAGYSPTPAEEMTGDEGQPVIQKPQRKSNPAVQEAIATVSSASPEVLNAVFEEETVKSPANVFTQPQTVVGKCEHKRIQPAGISKHGKPYKSFCRDCKVTLG